MGPQIVCAIWQIFFFAIRENPWTSGPHLYVLTLVSRIPISLACRDLSSQNYLSYDLRSGLCGRDGLELPPCEGRSHLGLSLLWLGLDAPYAGLSPAGLAGLSLYPPLDPPSDLGAHLSAPYEGLDAPYAGRSHLGLSLP